MHLYFFLRGIKQEADLTIKFLETQFFFWRRKNLNKCVCGQAKKGHKKTKKCDRFRAKEEVCRAQGALRPIQLFEYVFPEEAKDEVLTMLEISQPKKDKKGNPIKKDGFVVMEAPKINEKSVSFLSKFLRKALGAKPIGEYKGVPTLKFIPRRGVALTPIGIKPDRKEKWEQVGFEQEML